MSSAALVQVSLIQLVVFLGPVALARAGLVDGELAGLIAIVGWFTLGVPSSYAVLDRARRRPAREGGERSRHTAASIAWSQRPSQPL